MLLQKAAVQAGLLLAVIFGVPAIMVIVTGGLQFSAILLLPLAAYSAVRWQCRIGETLAAARRAWRDNAHID